MVRVVRETEEEARFTDAGIANQLFVHTNFKRVRGRENIVSSVSSSKKNIREREREREILRADLIEEKLLSLKEVKEEEEEEKKHKSFKKALDAPRA